MNKTIISTLLMAAVVISGCYSPRYVYSPSTPNVPILKQKGDLYGAALYSKNVEGDKFNDTINIVRQQTGGLDLHGAVAVSKKWAIQSSYCYRQEKNHGNTITNNLDSTVVRYKRNLFEVGAGYFASPGKMNQTFFQVFGGVGFGRLSFTDIGRMRYEANYSRFFKARVTKFYIQPAIMFIDDEYPISTSLSSKFSMVYFSDVNTNYTTNEQELFLLSNVKAKPYIFWEPSVNLSAGFKNFPAIRLNTQFGFSFLMNKRFIDSRNVNVSIGCIMVLPNLLKKKAA